MIPAFAMQYPSLAAENVLDVLRLIRTLNVGPVTFYRLLERCHAVHEDGQAFGWRGLVPQARVCGYERTAGVARTADGRTVGAAGLFRQLPERRRRGWQELSNFDHGNRRRRSSKQARLWW